MNIFKQIIFFLFRLLSWEYAGSKSMKKQLYNSCHLFLDCPPGKLTNIYCSKNSFPKGLYFSMQWFYCFYVLTCKVPAQFPCLLWIWIWKLTLYIYIYISIICIFWTVNTYQWFWPQIFLILLFSFLLHFVVQRFPSPSPTFIYLKSSILSLMISSI